MPSFVKRKCQGIKKHKNGFYCLAFTAATVGAGVLAYKSAGNLNLAHVFTFAAAAPVLGDLAYRQLREWWKKEPGFLKNQGAGYVIGQISGLSAGFSFVAGAAAVHGLRTDQIDLSAGGGALCILFAASSAALLTKGNACLKTLRKIPLVRNKDIVPQDVKYSKGMAGFTAFRRFAKTVAYAGIIAGGVWLSNSNTEEQGAEDKQDNRAIIGGP